MGMLYGFLILLEVIFSFLLIILIFMQKSKGGMGGSAFGGGGAGEAIFGSRMGNVLTKATVVLAVAFLANTLLLTVLTARHTDSGSVMDQVQPDAAQPRQQPMQMPGEQDLNVEGDLPYATPDSMPGMEDQGTAIEEPAVDLPQEGQVPPSMDELAPDQESLPAAMPNLPAAE